MIKWLNLSLLFIAILALVGVYLIKYQTVEIANQKLALTRTIEQQKSDISTLKADWAYLNQPAYIEPIIIRHQELLGLYQIEQKQFMNIEDLPMRVAIEPDDAALTAFLAAIESGVDPIALLIEANSQ